MMRVFRGSGALLQLNGGCVGGVLIGIRFRRKCHRTPLRCYSCLTGLAMPAQLRLALTHWNTLKRTELLGQDTWYARQKY